MGKWSSFPEFRSTMLVAGCGHSRQTMRIEELVDGLYWVDRCLDCDGVVEIRATKYRSPEFEEAYSKTAGAAFEKLGAEAAALMRTLRYEIWKVLPLWLRRIFYS